MKITELACPNCSAPLSVDFKPNEKVECTSCGSIFVATLPDTNESILCPQCKTVNDAEKRYCLSCGEGLKVDCILCHTANTLGTAHCVTCGAHLERSQAKRDKLQQKRRRLKKERTERLKEKTERQKMERLQLLLDDLDEPENHEFAIYQINQMGADAIEALLETLLHDTDPDARYGSARALGQICSEHDIKTLTKAKSGKALIKALADEEPAVRYWAADALASCGNKTAVEPLAALLKDSHDGVRQHAKEALEAIGGEKAAQILAQADKPKGLLGWIKS